MNTPYVTPEPIWTDDNLGWQMHPGRPCAEGYAEHWFPEGSPTDDYAAKLCAGCPVLQQCGDFALRTGETDGIWGGMTPRQRTVLVRDIKTANSQPKEPPSHCVHNHALDKANTYVLTRGGWGCKTCRNASKAASRARQKAARDAARNDAA